MESQTYNKQQSKTINSFYCPCRSAILKLPSSCPDCGRHLLFILSRRCFRCRSFDRQSLAGQGIHRTSPGQNWHQTRLRQWSTNSCKKQAEASRCGVFFAHAIPRCKVNLGALSWRTGARLLALKSANAQMRSFPTLLATSNIPQSL